jgi:hypothetical protein
MSRLREGHYEGRTKKVVTATGEEVHVRLGYLQSSYWSVAAKHVMLFMIGMVVASMHMPTPILYMMVIGLMVSNMVNFLHIYVMVGYVSLNPCC